MAGSAWKVSGTYSPMPSRGSEKVRVRCRVTGDEPAKSYASKRRVDKVGGAKRSAQTNQCEACGRTQGAW